MFHGSFMDNVGSDVVITTLNARYSYVLINHLCLCANNKRCLEMFSLRGKISDVIRLTRWRPQCHMFYTCDCQRWKKLKYGRQLVQTDHDARCPRNLSLFVGLKCILYIVSLMLPHDLFPTPKSNKFRINF